MPSDPPRPRGSLVIAIVVLLVGAALLVYALTLWPGDEHHGEAMNAWDGIGRVIALLAGGVGVALIGVGGWLVHRARGPRAAFR